MVRLIYILMLLFLTGCFISNFPTKRQSLGFVHNPYGFTPLSAVYRLHNSNKKPITITVEGKTADSDISYTYPAGYGNEFPIHGLYPDYENRIKITGQISTNITFKTPPVLVSGVEPVGTVHTGGGDGDPFNRDLIFLSYLDTYNVGWAVLGFDFFGELRYYIKLGYNMIGMDKINDRIRIFWVVGGIGAKNEGIQAETDLLGQKILFFNRAVHHDQTKKGNNYIVLDEREWGWEDIIEERTPQGDIVKTIAFGDILRKEAKTAKETNMIHRLVYDDKNIYHKNGNLKRTDYIHLNSVVYDNKTDILYLSSRHHGVFAVEYNTLSLLWWMADDSLKTKRGIGYGQIVPESLQLQDIPFLQAKRMHTPKGKGPKNQHALLLRKNGNLLMFDNQGDEEHNIQGSKVIEYSFSGLSAAVVREFVHPEKVYARITSDVDVLPNGNILVFYGSSLPLRVTEVDTANNIVLDMTFNMRVNTDGLENFEDVNIAYRADKMPLYPYKDKNKKYSIENREE